MDKVDNTQAQTDNFSKEIEPTRKSIFTRNTRNNKV